MGLKRGFDDLESQRTWASAAAALLRASTLLN